jgi:isopentenyl-diphosphate Delta-isomerase
MLSDVMHDYVIVVNALDEELGHAEKLQAHRTPVLHRAFSVFLLDDRGAMLLQRRAAGKYHSAGLWSNTCCGHPRPGEAVMAAAARRLREEMGIECALLPAGTVSYSIDVGGGLREDEFNHVLAGVFNGEPQPDPAEVWEWRWMTPEALDTALRDQPHAFTPWFGVVLDRLRGSGLLPSSECDPT